MNSMVLAACAVFALVVHAIADAPPGPEKVYNDAGYITVKNGIRTSNLFYWFFESRNDPANDPFVLWMTGGPGCSGLVGMLGENGPYIVQEDLSLKLNPYSWNNNATVLWIDQPVDTGFSYGGPPIVNEKEMADDMHAFLEAFFVKYPKYAPLPFHIVGESYAGHYVPVLSARVLNETKQGRSKINYKGSAVGNGLTDPTIQFQYYPKYVKEYNGNTALDIKPAEIDLMEALEPVCYGLSELCNNVANTTEKAVACLNAYVACSYGELVPVELSGINLYDVREKCNPALPLCYNFTLIDDYLHQPEVMKALGTTGHKWTECNRLVDLVMAYSGDWMVNYQQNVAFVLDNDLPFLIYAGEFDFICNWMGNNAWTQVLPWTGKSEFAAATNQTWTVDGEMAGTYRTAKGFTFMKVKDAGHMVPRDQPKNSLDMLNRFLFSKPFSA